MIDAPDGSVRIVQKLTRSFDLIEVNRDPRCDDQLIICVLLAVVCFDSILIWVDFGHRLLCDVDVLVQHSGHRFEGFLDVVDSAANHCPARLVGMEFVGFEYTDMLGDDMAISNQLCRDV